MTNRINVLAVIETLGRGGAETLLLHLVPSLLERGIRMNVVALMAPETLTEGLEAAGVTVYRLGGPNGWRADRLLPRLARIVRAERPDILHAHLFFGGLYTGLLPRWVHGGPRVLSLHCVDYIEHPATTPRKRLRKRLHKTVLHHRITDLVAVSRSVAQHYEEEMGLRDIEVIYNALPDLRLGSRPPHDRATKSSAGLDPDRPLVLSIGRFTEQKGHAHLIEAGQWLRAFVPGIQIAIVGEGPLRQEYHRLANEHGLTDVVRVLNPMPHAELMSLLEATDVFVMPSLYEGFGIAAAEGMALGRPTVVTSIGPFLEFVDDNITGLVVPPANPKHLADAIVRLFAEPARARRLGRAAQASVQERFGADTVATQWARFYERTLCRRRTSITRRLGGALSRS